MDAGDEMSTDPSARPLHPNGPWDLPIEGFEVSSLVFAYPIDIVAYGDGGVSTRIRFQGAFDFAQPRRRIRHLGAGDAKWPEFAVLFVLRFDRIARASATEDDAQLQIDFASGRVLTAGPDPHYENWEVTGPGFQLISLPGGGVAHFTPTEQRRIEPS
jgi:hypothetical protein